MYVARTSDGTLTTFEANRNSSREVDKSDIRALFEDYNEKASKILGEYERADNGETVTIEAIAFNQEGVRELVSAYDGRIADPNPSRKTSFISRVMPRKVVTVAGSTCLRDQRILLRAHRELLLPRLMMMFRFRTI